MRSSGSSTAAGTRKPSTGRDSRHRRSSSIPPGRPGPATWELGQYSAGQSDYPVGGVSWHEAVAYCRSENKTLPTIYHWARAALSPVEIGSPVAPAIIPISNFGGKGPTAVGASRAIGPYGTHDMAGNVREWVWNETADKRRWILGGQWGDPWYLFVVPNSLPAEDRAAANGFRCARYNEGKPMPDRLLARVRLRARPPRRKPSPTKSSRSSSVRWRM